MFRSYLIIDHLRVKTRSPVDPIFLLAICLGWAPSGVLAYNSPPQKKNVSTQYHGPNSTGLVDDSTNSTEETTRGKYKNFEMVCPVHQTRFLKCFWAGLFPYILSILLNIVSELFLCSIFSPGDQRNDISNNKFDIK